MVNGEQAAVVGPGQALAGFLPDSILVPIIATLSLAELRHITTPSDPNGPEGAPVPAEAEAPRIALV
jgi:hypothetical protein